jgi:protein-S-isoprenylcysteine O-methyltransferase Ste14
MIDIIKVVVVSALLLAAAALIFGRVRRDYRVTGKLTPFSTFLEVLIFFLHGSASYAFLDSNLAHVNTASPLFFLSVLCMLVGLVLVVIAMGRLGMDVSVGQQVSGLQQSGLYRYSRNPQIVAYGLVVIGYALLWPSWTGLVWVGLYLAIAHLMVRVEEDHLRQAYGEAYQRYCAKTPRYLGLPGLR